MNMSPFKKKLFWFKVCLVHYAEEISDMHEILNISLFLSHFIMRCSNNFPTKVRKNVSKKIHGKYLQIFYWLKIDDLY